MIQISQVPSKSKLNTGPARLHLQDGSFSLVSGSPPRLMGVWPLVQLRRYGIVNGKFCFEGGSLCGKGEYHWIQQLDKLFTLVLSKIVNYGLFEEFDLSPAGWTLKVYPPNVL